jgi:hypothetical protein
MVLFFKNSTKLKITDDSGFIAIVNADKYNSFVDENWELTQLLNRFVDEMNKDALIIWATGSENEWTVEFFDRPSNKKAFREFQKSITVTTGQFFLTNYEDLTMAAQFNTEKIPADHNSDLCIKLDNGNYNFTIRQMFDPDDYDYESKGKTNFEIIMQADTNSKQKVDSVFWWTN